MSVCRLVQVGTGSVRCRLSHAGRFSAARSEATLTYANCGLVGSVSASDVHVALVILPPHIDAPWIAAHFAVLYQRAVDVWLNVDNGLFPAVRTLNREFVFHGIKRGARIAPTAHI